MVLRHLLRPPTATLAVVRASLRRRRPRTLWPSVPELADARIDTESRRPIEGEGNFPLFKALKSHKTRKLLPRTPRQGSAPLRNPQHRRRLDGVARVLFDRSSFGICSNSESRRPNGEEENYPPCKALKSPRMRKSLPRHPWRDQSPAPHRLDEHGRRLQPDRAEIVSSMSRLSYRHLSLFQPESEHAHIRRMSLQAVAL
jgi:hypothetical protein